MGEKETDTFGLSVNPNGIEINQPGLRGTNCPKNHLPPKTTLQHPEAVCNSRRAMTKTLLALSLLLAVATGCVNTVTNLTPTTITRSPNNMYRVEYQWDSTQQTVRPGSIKPFVVVGFDQYEMRPVMRMNNRWEVWIPVPAGKTETTYRFKVYYDYTTFGSPKTAVKLSEDYKLAIQ